MLLWSTGRYKASEYKFPFPDEHFDFVVLNSVFTHMLPADMDNYLSEIARVMKTGGRSLISFFLLNAESVSLIERGKSTQDLRYEFGPARAGSKETPELAIGYSEDYLTDLYAKYGLQVRRPIHYGSWCGRTTYLSYQDLIVGWKERREESEGLQLPGRFSCE